MKEIKYKWTKEKTRNELKKHHSVGETWYRWLNDDDLPDGLIFDEKDFDKDGVTFEKVTGYRYGIHKSWCEKVV